MRVFLWMVGGDKIPGGHRVQLEQTCKHLRALGVDAYSSFEEEPDLSNYDMVHAFGITLARIRKCHQANLPLVISTIYPGQDFVLGQHIKQRTIDILKWRGRTGLVLLRSALQGRHIEKCQIFVERLQNIRVCFEMADLLLPNSQSEAAAIREELGVTTPYHIVPNAVDEKTFTVNNPISSNTQPDVLYVGRFEPHKNQLGLIEAMRHSEIPVRLVGHPHPHHTAYYEQCKRRVTNNIKILQGIPHEELAPLYRSAKVHVLPSWFETTGLVSLEAALCGCNVVTTNRGYAHDYFKDMAWYCDPTDPASIRQAIKAAYQAPFQYKLCDRILHNFTWEHTAQATFEAYKKVLRI